MSLAECLDLALSQNLDLQIEHLSSDIAHYNLTGAYGAYVPNVTLGARHDTAEGVGEFDYRKFNPYYPYELDTDSGGPSLTGRLPLGFSYSFDASAGQRRDVTDFTGNPDLAKFFPPNGIRSTNNYFAELGLSVRQHLLKDFWIDRDWETLLWRRADARISEAALRFQVMRTVLAVELAFYDYLASCEQVRVQEMALTLRQQFVAETRRRVEVGDLPPLDYEQAQTQLQNTLTALAAAREASANLQNALKVVLTDNFRDWAEVDLRPAGALVARKTDANRQRSFQNALTNRPDLVEARLAIQKSAVTVRFQQNQLFPALDFVGRYGGVGVNSDLGGSMAQAMSFHVPNYFYGVVLSFPLDNVAERNSYRASKAAKQIAELQLKKAEQCVLQEVADYLNQVEWRYAQTDSTRKAREYAEAALAAEEKKLANGLSTTYMVLQLQEVLTAARTAEIVALASYNKAYAQFTFAEGANLEAHRIRLDGK